jgi:glutaredoxin
MVPAVFMIGLHIGPRLSNWYHTAFPLPAYTTGDHAELYAKAGTAVVLYATSTCPYCAKARDLFAARSVRYTEYQIDKSEQAKKEFLALQGAGVPLLYIGDRRIEGYLEPVILDALAAVDKEQ